MRILLVALVASFTFAGVAGVASATATVDLLWASNGTDSLVANAGDTITLDVFITAGPDGVSSFGLSVDYAQIALETSVAGFTNAPGGLAPFQFPLGSTTDSGTQINNFVAAGFLAGLAPGATFWAGTIDFDVDLTATPGSYTIASFLNGPPVGTDAINNAFLQDVGLSSTFNSATLMIDGEGPEEPSIPEPSAALLFGVGLTVFAARRRRP